MISEKLFEMAFLYKKTKLWKSLLDTEIFAVRLPDGETGYCSIMGNTGEHCALGLYVGDRGFHSFRIAMNGLGTLSELNEHEFLLSQDCIQCAFAPKDELSEGEAAAVRQYARRHGISLRGRNAFPYFLKYRPNYLPWFLKDSLERVYLCEALSAAVEVARRLETEKKTSLGLLPVSEKSASVPLREQTAGGFVWSSVPLPKPMPVQYPRPRYVNDIAAAKLRRLKKNGFWECEVIRFPEPMQNSPEEAPYFPVMLLAVSGEVLPPRLSEHYEENPEELADQFAEMFLEKGIRPALLSVRSERTRILLEDFCDRAGIRMRMCSALPLLDEAVDSMMAYLGMNRMQDSKLEKILDMLLRLDDSDLDNLPDEIKQQFAEMIEQENLPDEIAGEFADRFLVDCTPPKTKKYDWIGQREMPEMPFIIHGGAPEGNE